MLPSVPVRNKCAYLRAAFFFTVIALFPLVLLAQTPDEVINAYLKARGGLDKVKAVKTERVTATVTLQPGADAVLTYERKRPLKMHMEITLNGESFIRVYDGKSAGWVYNPFTPKAAVVAMTPEEIRGAAEESDLDGPFVDYKGKGNQLEFLGTEDLDGKPARKLKLTAKSGEVSYCFFDARTGLIAKIQSTRKIKNEDVPWETTFSDFREVEGLRYPFLVESGAVGSDQVQRIAASKIEINLPLEDSRFDKPVPSEPPPQPADPAKSN
jgi:outer membrane lipoprotein-sorting protein